MIINKVLNNNVVITSDENGEETIVMGKGIGYQKAKGDTIDEEKINKVFRISNREVSDKFQELFNKIPIEHMKLSGEIIEYAENTVGKKLNEGIYISLSDHTYTAIKRIKNNIIVKNALLWEIKKFYKEEFKIGMKALDLIEEKTHVRLPEDEAGFIALHIVNAQLDVEQPKVQEITKLIEEILTIVRINFRIEFNEDSVFYYRFITHLRYFAQRLFSNSTYNSGADDELVNIIQIKYPEEFKCVSKVKLFIIKKYNYELSNDEYVYLTIHIAKIIQDSKL